ncbi:MAG: hypothetical protein V4772_00850 [Pseudomonadota bacterium]
MKRQNSLFDDPEPADQATSSSTVLVISGQRLAPEQKLFNQLLAKIEKNKEALTVLMQLLHEHRVQFAKCTAPLEQQQVALRRQMILFLDQRLQNKKGLSKGVRAYMADFLCGQAASLMQAEDGADMKEIYDRHAPPDGPDGGADVAAAMQDMMSDVFGLDMDDDETLDSPEQVMAAAMRKMQEQHEQRASAEAARKAKRKKTPKQLQAERESIDADKVLRDIYRKLASALHPDREPDEQERQRKTALMVEVNIANEKKDLLALLQLQLKVEQIDPETVSAMAEDKLRHFNRVLKEQAKSLETELRQAEFMFRSEFDLSYGVINPRALEISIRQTVRGMEQAIRDMKDDLAQIQDDKGLKAWVKSLRSMDDDFDELDMMELAAMSAVFSKGR